MWLKLGWETNDSTAHVLFDIHTFYYLIQLDEIIKQWAAVRDVSVAWKTKQLGFGIWRVLVVELIKILIIMEKIMPTN